MEGEPRRGGARPAASSAPGPRRPSPRREPASARSSARPATAARRPDGIQMDGPVVLAEGESRAARRAVSLVPREPGRAARSRRARVRAPGAARARARCARGRRPVEREELAFARRPAPGAERVAEPARRTRLVVPLAVEHDLGALGRAGPQPRDERRRAPRAAIRRANRERPAARVGPRARRRAPTGATTPSASAGVTSWMETSRLTPGECPR